MDDPGFELRCQSVDELFRKPAEGVHNSHIRLADLGHDWFQMKTVIQAAKFEVVAFGASMSMYHNASTKESLRLTGTRPFQGLESVQML